MSKRRSGPEVHKRVSKKRLIQDRLRQQVLEREQQFFPQPDPPILKPLG
jgi:hypothetical protein